MLVQAEVLECNPLTKSCHTPLFSSLYLFPAFLKATLCTTSASFSGQSFFLGLCLISPLFSAFLADSVPGVAGGVHRRRELLGQVQRSSLRPGGSNAPFFCGYLRMQCCRLWRQMLLLTEAMVLLTATECCVWVLRLRWRCSCVGGLAAVYGLCSDDAAPRLRVLCAAHFQRREAELLAVVSRSECS